MLPVCLGGDGGKDSRGSLGARTDGCVEEVGGRAKALLLKMVEPGSRPGGYRGNSCDISIHCSPPFVWSAGGECLEYLDRQTASRYTGRADCARAALGFWAPGDDPLRGLNAVWPLYRPRARRG